MKRLIYLVLLFFAAGLPGCNRGESTFNCGDVINQAVNLIKSHHISIPVPDSLNYDLRHTVVNCQVNSGCFYYGLDPLNNSVDIYNLSTNRFITSLRYFNDGRPGSFPITTFYVHNADSIFLFSEELLTLILVNTGNEIKYKCDLKYALQELEQKHRGLFLDMADKDMVYLKHGNLICFKLGNELYSPPASGFFNTPLIAAFSLRHEKFSGVFGDFPEECSNNPTPLSIGFYLTGTGADSGVLVNFYSLPYLMEITPAGESKKICRKSNHLPDKWEEYSGDFSDFRSFQQYLISNGYYTKCLTGKNGNLKAVVVKHAVTSTTFDRPANAFDAPFSILLCDNNQVAGEANFESSRYNYYNTHLMDEKWLLLDCNNINNPQFREGYLEFDVFELK
ncbi:MAG: hypothetical protein KatS3mg032_0855 [Cyclobacteriaceae bacterium]|nr:MAG: hypothetical protein KatS3mg032_0855 [Cyclobacteriaceae bacterium]